MKAEKGGKRMVKAKDGTPEEKWAHLEKLRRDGIIILIVVIWIIVFLKFIVFKYFK
jgi:hypothetical protein